MMAGGAARTHGWYSISRSGLMHFRTLRAGSHAASASISVRTSSATHVVARPSRAWRSRSRNLSALAAAPREKVRASTMSLLPAQQARAHATTRWAAAPAAVPASPRPPSARSAHGHPARAHDTGQRRKLHGATAPPGQGTNLNDQERDVMEHGCSGTAGSSARAGQSSWGLREICARRLHMFLQAQATLPSLSAGCDRDSFRLICELAPEIRSS